MSGSAHLLEIDLLRDDTRFATGTPLPAAAYFVFLSRAENRKDVEVWPIPLASPLPQVAVPLLPGDTDVVLDLQLALATIYDILGYDELLAYRQPPPGTLNLEAATWVEEQLRRAGRRAC